jgi:hypothetical protein
MLESPNIDSLSEDEAATLVLVDANDSPLGSVSLSERLVMEENAERVIHRTCSLHIFSYEDATGTGNPSSRILLSRSFPVPVVGNDYFASSHVSLTFEFMYIDSLEIIR